MLTLSTLIFKAGAAIAYVGLVSAVLLNGSVKYSMKDDSVTYYHTSPALVENSLAVTLPVPTIEHSKKNNFAENESDNDYLFDDQPAPAIEHMESIVLLEKYKLEKKIETKLFKVYDERENLEYSTPVSDMPEGYFYDEVAENITAPPKASQDMAEVGINKGLSLAEADQAIAEINQNLQIQYGANIANTASEKPEEIGSSKNNRMAANNKKPIEEIISPERDERELPTPQEDEDYLKKMSQETSTEIQLFSLAPMSEKELDKLRFKVDLVSLSDGDTRIHSANRFNHEVLWPGVDDVLNESGDASMMAVVIDKDFVSVRFDLSSKEIIKQIPLISNNIMTSLDPSFFSGNTGAVLINLLQIHDNKIPFASIDGKVQVGNVLYLDDSGNIVEGADATYVLLYRLPTGNVFIGFENENKNTAMDVVHLIGNEILYIDRKIKENFTQTVTFHVEHLMGRISQDYNLDLGDWAGEFQGFDLRKINYNTLEITSPLVWAGRDQFIGLNQGDSQITIALTKGVDIIEIPSEEFVGKVYEDLRIDSQTHCLLQLNISEKLAASKHFIIDEIHSKVLTREIKGGSSDTSLEELEIFVLDESGVYQKDEWEKPRKIFTASEGTGNILLTLKLRSGEIETLSSPCAPGTYVVKTITK